MTLSAATDHDLTEYMEGSCHLLAIALHRKLGWRLRVALDQDAPFWEDPADADNIIPTVLHVWAVDPNDRAWDIRGVRPLADTRQEAEDQWAPGALDMDDCYQESELRGYVGFWADDGEEPIERPLFDYTDALIEEAWAVAQRALATVPGWPAAPEQTMRDEDWVELERLGWTEGRDPRKDIIGFLFDRRQFPNEPPTRRDDLTRRLLSSGSDPHSIDSDGWSLLHRLIPEHVEKATVEAVLQAGAEVNVVADDGWTALHLAVIHGPNSLVELLLRRQANPNLRLSFGDNEDSFGATPWLDAVTMQNQSHAVLATMKECGARLHDTNDKGRGAVHLASAASLPWVLDHTDVGLENRDANGCTPLMYQSYQPCVEILLARGADVMARNNQGDTALAMALRDKDREKCHALLDAGASTEDINALGQDALTLAEEAGIHIGVIERLRALRAQQIQQEMDRNLPAVTHKPRPTKPRL